MAKLRKNLFRLLFLAFVLLNVLALWQSRRLTHFAGKGESTPPVSELSGAQKWKVLLTGAKILRPENDRTPEDVGLPAPSKERIDMHSSRHLGTWTVEAENPVGVFLLFHGYAESSEDMLEVGKLLHGLNYHTLYVDFPGSGGSSGNTTTLGHREHVSVKVAYEHAQEKWPDLPICIYGASMGSVATLRAQYFGLVAPDAVIMEAPFNSLRDTVSNRVRSMGIPAFPAMHLLLLYGGLQARINTFQFIPERYASGVDCPILLLRGAEDETVTADNLQSVAGAIRSSSPRVEERTLEGAGHRALARTVPEAWGREVTAFVQSLGHRPRTPAPQPPPASAP